jgi:hypothetical protein
MKTRNIVMGLIAVLTISSCDKANDQDPTSDINYIITASPEGGGGEVIHPVPTLTSGQYTIGQAREIANNNWQQLANGNLYASWGSGYKEYEFTDDGGIVAGRSLAVELGGLYDIGDGQLLGIRTDYDYTGPYMVYDIVDVASFTVTATDSIPLPQSAGTLVYATGAKVHGDKIIIAFVPCDDQTYMSNKESVYAAVIDRATLDYEKTITDNRTVSLGIPYFGGQDNVTYKGNLYIQTSNTNWWGADEAKPSGILRIKANETEFDDEYFLDVTSLTGGSANVLLADAGNGKAITQVHRQDLITDYSDFDNKYTIEHWVIDLENKSASKLDIPLSLGTGIKIVQVDDNNYAIAASTQTGSFFYIYNSSTNTLRKGAEYIGGILGFPAKVK